MALNAFEQLFVLEYLKDFNASAAARRAGATGSDVAIRSRGCRALQAEEVQDAIAVAVAERAKRAEISSDEVLRQVHAIATADTNEIIEHRRICCRCCWGLGFRYQRTAEELAKDRRQHESGISGLVEDFDIQGGDGFVWNKEPNPECPECAGEGLSAVFVKDTRFLSPAARALYAGVKTTKDGIEVKLHSKDKHLELLMRHLGLLKDKLEVTGTITLADRIRAARKRVSG